MEAVTRLQGLKRRFERTFLILF